MLYEDLKPVRLDGAEAEFDSELGGFIEDVGAEEPGEALVQSTLREEIDRALELLEPREARILQLRFGLEDGEPCTFREIGGMLGLSRERIRQLQKEALYQLRHSNRDLHLREYLLP